VLGRRVLARLVGVSHLRVRVLDVVVETGAEGAMVVVVSMRAREHPSGRWRCGVCQVLAPGYDRGRERRWRALDWGRVAVFVQARAPRVCCPEHGVVTAMVPWARHGARHTAAFEQQAAWCATQMSGTATAALMRCSWRSVGAMVRRVLADLRERAGGDGLDGLRRIGIDEISYRRGHTYLVVVIDHDTRRLVWACPGREDATVTAFFDALGPARTAALTHITSDAASWIKRPVRARAEHAVHCADPFHVLRWAGTAVDDARRKVWNAVRRTAAQGGGRNKPAVGDGKTINIATWALRKNQADWTPKQQAAMTWVTINHPRLHHAWRLKESLRAVFAAARADRAQGPHLLDSWVEEARGSELEEFHDVARKIVANRAEIDACLTTGLNNGLTESTNTKIRLITRRGFGFRDVHALIALTQLSVGRYQPVLPL
jgi:transposase